MTSGYLSPCEDLCDDSWDDVWLGCAKMVDEHLDERKNDATSWDRMWRGATLFLSTDGEENASLEHTSRLGAKAVHAGRT